MKRNITIKDIARELGIAPSTVSRALKDNPELNKETKKKVLELAKKLNYVPNSIALSLKSNKTNTIAVVLPELVHFFFSTVISGIEDVAYSKGYHVFVTQSNESYEREVADCKALYNSRTDGYLICPSKTTQNFDHISAFIDKGLPVVLFDRDIPELDCTVVKVDDFKGGFIATQHLIDAGCRRVAFIGGPSTLGNISEREHGYREALTLNHLHLDETLVIHVDYPVDTAEKRSILESILDVNADGIFVHNDMLAIELLQIAKSKGIKVPDAIKIIGFSNWLFTQYTSPSLSTVEQNGYEIGKRAAEALFEEINSNTAEEGFVDTKKILLEPVVIPRDSSANLTAHTTSTTKL